MKKTTKSAKNPLKVQTLPNDALRAIAAGAMESAAKREEAKK
jgi:hypothetical protein